MKFIDLFADIGSDFDAFYLPRLLEKRYVNNAGLPQVIRFILGFDAVLLVMGVLTPIILMSVNFSESILLYSTYTSVVLLSLIILFFLFRFKSILEDEVNVLYKG